MKAHAFVDRLQAHGYEFFSGVPCSLLTSLLNDIVSRDSLTYVGATQEGEAVAIAAGAWLAGRKTAVLAQNSGLGNMVNPITSLNVPYRIPALLLVSWRGEPGRKDEAQHALMGSITPALLALMGTECSVLPIEEHAAGRAVDEAAAWHDAKELPCALICRDEMFEHADYNRSPSPPPKKGVVERVSNGVAELTRFRCLEIIRDVLPSDALVISTTGKCSRELCTLDDRPEHFYLVGAMGSASSIGLGVAMNSRETVVVLDGDGAALMRLGNFATVGACSPQNLLHIVLDNGRHDSTGGQPTASSGVDLTIIAAACGYTRVASCHGESDLRALIPLLIDLPGPCFLRVFVRPGSHGALGRPTIPLPDLRSRFSERVRRGC